MSIVVVGLNERDAPLDLLERVTVAERDLPKALQQLLDSPHLSEAVVLSTCMRTEVYAVLERFHDGLADIEGFFADRAGASLDAAGLSDRLVVSYDDAAAQHLFEVAAGIDSAVLGEGEILRQVRHAAEVARRERASGPILAGLFRHALVAGKRARTETAIARGITSLAHVAVAEARAHFGGTLADRTAVVIGTGEMGEELVAELSKEGLSALVVANRSAARAQRLAAAHGGRGVALAATIGELDAADFLISATTAEEALVDFETVGALQARRQDRPLLIIDLAVPRDIDPQVARVAGVRLLDLGDLRAYAEREMQARRAEVAAVREVIAGALEEYRLDARARSAAPLVTALRQRAEEVRAAELARAARRLDHLSEEDRALVAELSRRLVAKLIHEPTSQVKRAAGTQRGERLAEALRILYDL